MQGVDRARKVPRRAPAGEEVEQRRAQRIVHHAVQRAAERVGAQLAVGHLVGGVLPDLAQDRRLRVFELDAGAQLADEVVRQFVRDVQPPAGGPARDPLRHHAVLVVDDEVAVAAAVFVHLGQGLDAPPAVVLLRIVVEAVPGGVRRVLGLIGAHGVVEAVAVEVDAVVPRVGEDAVQHHADAVCARRAAQADEVLVRAEGRVHVRVVARVVLVVGLGVKDRVQVEHGDAELAQIGQLLDDAREVSAEEVVPKVAAQGRVGVLVGLFVPGGVRDQAGLFVQQGRAAVAEAVHKDLVHDAVVHPGGDGVGAVVHRDLEGGRQVRGNLSLAAQALRVVAVPEHLPVRVHEERVPQDHGLLGKGEGDLIEEGVVHVPAKAHGQLFLALFRPEAQRAVGALGRGDAQPHARAAGACALRPAILLALGVVLEFRHRTYLPPWSGSRCQILSMYSLMVRSEEK